MSDFNIQFEEQDQVITLEFEQAGGGAVKSVNGKTGVVVLDAEDVGAYTKPSGGIPKTDLASSVQTSLGKADSAYQKPSGGIPASDIASGAIPTVDNTLTTAGAAADAKKVGDEISDLKEDYQQILDSAYVTDTASGSIASFPDGAGGVPVKSLKVNIEPVQSGSGDPSPDNVRPISGHTQAVVTRTGVQLFDTDNKMLFNGFPNTSDTMFVSNNQYRTTYIPCKGNTTYTISKAAGKSFRIATSILEPSNGVPFQYTDANHTGTSITLTTRNDAKYLAVMFWSSMNGDTMTADQMAATIQIEYGSTATAYEPYQGQTVTIDLGETRYGGTLDIGTGVLTVTHAFYTINGQYAVNKHSATTLDGYYIELSRNGLPRCASTQDGTVGQFNMFKIGKLSDGNGCAFVGADTIQFRKDGGGTGAEMKAWLANNPLQVVYPLATPQTVQLTAEEVTTLLGQNNIWADCGDTEVEYRADTKLYIEKLTAPTEDDMIADHAISANSFFMVGNNLYRATTAIASGATITVGTNATKLSLSDALNALA